MKTLQRDELKHMLDSGEYVQLINVLNNEQFREAHIPGSVNLPQAEKDFVDQVEELVEDKDDEVVVYCASFDCAASPTAAKKLEDAGFTHVFDYEGGLKDWREGGLPIERAQSRH